MSPEEGRPPPKVSIGIAAWRSQYVERAIRSVLDQGHDDVEVVVTDDAGDSERIVAEIGDPRVHYRRNERRLGVAGNARAAYDLCRGEYIGLLGDDDQLLTGFLGATVKELDADPELGLVFTNYYVEEEGVRYRRGTNLAEGRHDNFLRSYIERQRVPASATLMRREVWEEGERFLPMPADVAPDLFLFARAAFQGWPFFFIDRNLMAYQLHSEMTSRSDAYRDAPIATWEQFRFDDPFCEDHRRRLLGEAYVNRGAARVRARQARDARQDFRRAREVDPDALRRYRRAYSTLAHLPFVIPFVEGARQRLRQVRPGREFTNVDRANPIVLRDE
jgi:glycosyltransferase involved in cell wall biosynthesis